MKDKFLTREQFERQSFAHWMRTGILYKYEDYLKYRTKLEKKSASNFIENILGIDPENFIPQKGKTYVQWSEGGCDECSDLGGQIFEAGTEPGEIHPNCQCYATVLDAEGFPTEEKIKLKPWKPKEKEKCAKITSEYGMREKHPVTGKQKFHGGIDISAPEGTPIKSAKSGTVQRSKAQRDFQDKLTGYGYYVRLKHTEEDGRITYSEYGHLEEQSHLSVNDIVEQGDLIGYVGSTGDSTGPHLHYTTREEDGSLNGKPFNPPQEEQDYLLETLNEACK